MVGKVDNKTAFKKVERVFIAMIIIFFVTLGGLSYVIRSNLHLAHENKQRILEIQANRVEACKTTYLGILKVFQPFFPHAPLTAKQKKDLDKFNKVIFTLQAKCTIASVQKGEGQ